MSLEDEIPDVIAKAMMGLGLNAAALAEKSGIGAAAINAILRGDAEEASLRKIAPALGLSEDALVGLTGYLPRKQEITGLSQLELPYRQWTVNAWLIEHGGIRLLFDTGFGENDILTALGSSLPDAVFITHSHEDHVGGIAALEAAGVRVISEEMALAETEFFFGEISLRAVDLSGHKSPTAGYILEGLEQRLLVAGDAIFAGSIGRCRSTDAYELAFTNLRRVLSEAGSDCIILPGHGPATTIAEEMVSNPFHPRFKISER